MIELGPCKGTIVSHRSRMAGDKTVIAIACDVGGERCEALIWLSEKAMGMARRALKLCGFDVDKHSLAILDSNPTMLAGNVVPLMVDEWNGKTTVKVDIDVRAERSALDSLTQKMRSAKKGASEVEAPEDIPF